MRQSAGWQIEAGTPTGRFRVRHATVMDLNISIEEIRQARRAIWLSELAKQFPANEIALTLKIGRSTVFQAIADAPRAQKVLDALKERHAS